MFVTTGAQSCWVNISVPVSPTEEELILKWEYFEEIKESGKSGGSEIWLDNIEIQYRQ